MTSARAAIESLCRLAVFITVASWPFVAHAESELALDWRATDACPDATWARRRVRERLGRELAAEVDTGLRVTAELTQKNEGFALSLRTEQGSVRGDRVITSARCDDLAEAAVLVIAIAIDPEAVARATSTPAPTETPEPRTAPVDDERPPGVRGGVGSPSRTVPDGSVQPAFLLVRGEAGGDLGALPTVAFGPAGALGYTFPWGLVELRGFWLPPSTGSDAPSVGRVRVGIWGLGPVGCLRTVGQRIRLLACAGVELGRTSARGLGLAEPIENDALWRAATAGPRLAIGLTSRVGLVLELSGVFALGRARFVSTDAQGEAKTTLFDPSPVSGRARLGLELRI